MSSIIRTLSSLSSNIIARNNVARITAELNKASLELATGYRADVFKDLGMQSSQSMELRSRMDRADAYVTSNILLGNKMQLISDVLGSAKSAAQGFLELAVLNLDSPGQTASELQQQALTALQSMTSMLNTNYVGESLFYGIKTDATPLQSYSEVNLETGLSPEDVLDGIVGGTVTDASDAASKIAALDAVFSSTNTSDPNSNFESTFYNGSPLLDDLGDPVARMSATVDDDRRVTYGIQANDPAITEIMKGLMMIVSMDVTSIDDSDAYKSWMQEAVNSVASGIDGLTAEQTRLGGQQANLEQTKTQQQDLIDLFTSQIIAFEGVDGYQAASRFSALEAQLEATYAVTARLSQLSFLNFM